MGTPQAKDSPILVGEDAILAKVDLTDNPSNWSTDQAGADNNGRNFKGTLNLNRLNKLTSKTNMLLKFNGQLAADNLDGADQLSLGGPSAVRAYPSNEAAGDLGFIASLELKRNFFKNVESTLFYDYGKIRQYKNSSNINLTTPNEYSLSGWGVSFDLIANKRVKLNLGWAQALGDNDGQSASGNNSDGRGGSSRAWFQVVFRF